MAILILLLIFLATAAVVYGVFFLIFKLVWVIAGKSRNKWPLILAGAATLLLFAAVTLATLAGINKYVKPFMGLADKALTKTQITTGVRPYKDPQYGFTMNLFGGTELSDWVRSGDIALAAGFDTNLGPISKALKAKGNEQAQPPVSGFAVVIEREDDPVNVREHLEEMVQGLTQAQNPQFRLTQEPDYSIPNTAFLKGEAVSNQGYKMNIYILLAAQDRTTYLVGGMSAGNPAYDQLAEEEIRSFRMPGVEPAPVAPGRSFTIPAAEVTPALSTAD